MPIANTVEENVNFGSGSHLLKAFELFFFIKHFCTFFFFWNRYTVYSRNTYVAKGIERNRKERAKKERSKKEEQKKEEQKKKSKKKKMYTPIVCMLAYGAKFSLYAGPLS